MDLTTNNTKTVVDLQINSPDSGVNDSAISLSELSDQSAHNLSRISSSENDDSLITSTVTTITSPSTRSLRRKLTTESVIETIPVKIKKQRRSTANSSLNRLSTDTTSSISTSSKNKKKSLQSLKIALLAQYSGSSVILKVENNATIKKSNLNETTAESTSNSKVKKEKKQYICHICEKQFLGITDLKRHLLVHTGEKPHQCSHCEKRFRQAVCLKNHIAAVHSDDFKFKCPKCPKKFPIKFRLRLHMRIHSGEKPYKCPKCPKTFARDGQLRQHKVTHTENCHKCITCNDTFETKQDLRKHMQNHMKQEHICQICMKSFSQPDLLRGHLFRTHANLKFCTICNKALKGHLSQHLKLHANERPFTCDICEAQFSQKSQLNVHQRMHSGERPYKCQVCWQTFAHSTVLKLHIRKHTGEKPFACYLCKEMGIAFSQLAHLKTHMRTIHQTVKPYVCEGCMGFYKIKAELEKHQKKCKKYDELKQKQQDKNIDESSSNSSSSVSAIDGQQQLNLNSIGNIGLIEQQKLSKLRLLIAILLKKISSEERLKQLGFEKRLIDNVIVTALKLASRKYHEDSNLDDLTRLRMNIDEFLNWTVPSTIMTILKKDKNSIEEILENIVSAYPQG